MCIQPDRPYNAATASCNFDPASAALLTCLILLLLQLLAWLFLVLLHLLSWLFLLLLPLPSWLSLLPLPLPSWLFLLLLPSCLGAFCYCCPCCLGCFPYLLRLLSWFFLLTAAPAVLALSAQCCTCCLGSLCLLQAMIARCSSHLESSRLLCKIRYAQYHAHPPLPSKGAEALSYYSSGQGSVIPLTIFCLVAK